MTTADREAIRQRWDSRQELWRWLGRAHAFDIAHADVAALLNSLDALEAERDRLRTLAKEATNGWACYAKRKIEHDEIARLHRQLDVK